MHGRFKKLYAVLMLVSFVFASVSPAFAVGIFEGKIFSEVGDKTDFAGYNWMLFKKDDKSGYIITTEGIGSSVFRYGTSDVNLYYSSVLRGKVNDYEKEMKSYTGPQLTWAEVNGTADGKNYIEKHDMSECAMMKPVTRYDDLLYILSVVEAEVLPADILRLGRFKDWWLRSKGSMGPLRVATIHHDVWGNPYVDYPGCKISDTLLVRPALQINLQSPIFAQTAFKTAPTGGKADVKVGDGFTLKDYDGSGGWKLTETDRSIPVPNATLTALAHWTIAIGNIVTVKYSGVKTGENTYLSALLYDNNGNLINYAKVADTSTNGSGEAQLSFKNLSLPSWNCKVAFVSEQVSGDNEPDRFSAPTAMYNVILTSNDGLDGKALLLPDSELPEQLKIKDEIKQTLPVPVLSPEQITGVSGLTEAVSKTRLGMTVEQSVGAEDKQTAKFKILLGNKIKDYNKNKRLAVLIADKAEQAADADDSAILMSDEDDFDTVITTAGEPDVAISTDNKIVCNGKAAGEARAAVEDGSGAKIGLADGGTLELTKYTAFKAEYEEDGDCGVISFSVPEYGKYFKNGTTGIIVAELNEDAKFDGEKSSSSGCNAGFGAFALLGVLGLFYRKKK